MTLISLFAAAWNRYRAYRNNVRNLRELRTLTPAQLRDIGVRIEGERILSIHDELNAEYQPRKEAIIIPPPEDNR
ncbi:MAG: DUF1127 domain-containing protein [Marinobacterium sp.]|nr:DUF1127 domain-containing protein [Marinobacterium sp.]